MGAVRGIGLRLAGGPLMNGTRRVGCFHLLNRQRDSNPPRRAFEIIDFQLFLGSLDGIPSRIVAVTID